MLENKVAIITGAAQGLGETVAYKLAGLGVKLALVDTSPKVEKVKQNINRLAFQAEAYLCDVTNTPSIHTTVAHILETFGSIDILVNNAGIWTDESLEQERPLLRRLAFDVNTLGTIEFTKAVLPTFERNNSGHIVNVISVAGISDSVASSNKKSHTYGATKWALSGYTNALQETVAGTGIKVTGFFPGGMDTNLYESAGRPNPHNQPWMMNAEDAADAITFVLTRPKDVLVERLVIRRN